MAQSLTNNSGLNMARESSLKTLPGSPDWKALEPNSIDTYGAEYQNTPRNPISDLRQRRKGTQTGRDDALEFEADVTMDSLDDFVESFVFATAVNADMVFRGVNAQASTSGYVIPAATAAQAAKFQYTSGGPISLVHAVGYATAANNSPDTVKPLSADVASTDTLIPVAGLSDETAPTNAEVVLAGIRAEAGDLALAVSGNIATLSSGNNSAVNNIDFTTLGLTAGQVIHVGGLTASNRFGSTAGGSNDSYGPMRIRTIAAGAITGDKLASTLTASDGTDTGSSGSNVAVDLLFSRFIRNVRSSDSDYNRISFHFEAKYAELYETEPPTPVANPDGFEYVTGAVVNELNMDLPLRDKATMTATLIASETEDIVDNASRKSGASAARSPLRTEAINTSGNLVRLQIADTDDTVLTTDLTNVTMSITNNVAPEFILGQYGARYINNGNFEVSIEATTLFNSVTPTVRVNANTTVTADWIFRNDDGAAHFDLPSCQVSSPGKEFTANETIKLNLQLETFVDSLLETSLGVSLFPVYPS